MNGGTVEVAECLSAFLVAALIVVLIVWGHPDDQE